MFSELIEKIKRNKKTSIVIIILVLIILFLQTSISLKNQKIDYLNSSISKLESELKSVNSTESKGSELNDSTKDKKAEDKIKDESSNKILENVKNRYIQFGKDEGKIYDENLNGVEIATFEWMDDSIVSDSQIKNGINKITKEKFNIKAYVKRVSGMNMYKIIVIE